MRVHVLEPISAAALARLSEGAEVVDWRDPRVTRWPEEADGLIVRTQPVAEADVARARRLKVIGKHGVGTDNIPLAAARAKGIPVVNTPGANADGVAELVLTLALAAARHVVSLDRALRAGTLGAIPSGRELMGCTLGVVGFGETGRRTADLFHRAFRSPVLIFKPGLTAAPEGMEVMGSLGDLLPRVDILSLHLPLSAATRHLIGARELGLMRHGSILVNAARGGLVDEVALAEALDRGRPAAAAFDAFEVEPAPRDHPLLCQANFIATPHIGAATQEALDKVGLLVVDQVLEVLAGKPPRFPVG